MNYKINYSSEAYEDINDIYEYIAYELLSPETAAGKVGRIMDSINKLAFMPKKHKTNEYEPWRSKGMRTFSADNFVIFYLVNDADMSVGIVRIIYGGRDINTLLDEKT